MEKDSIFCGVEYNIVENSFTRFLHQQNATHVESYMLHDVVRSCCLLACLLASFFVCLCVGLACLLVRLLVGWSHA